MTNKELLEELDHLCDEAERLHSRAIRNECPITAEVLTTVIKALDLNWMGIRRELLRNA